MRKVNIKEAVNTIKNHTYNYTDNLININNHDFKSILVTKVSHEDLLIWYMKYEIWYSIKMDVLNIMIEANIQQ